MGGDCSAQSGSSLQISEGNPFETSLLHLSQSTPINPSIHPSINQQSIYRTKSNSPQPNKPGKKIFKIRSWIQTHHFILLLSIVSNGAVDSDFDIAKHSAVGSSVQRGSRFGSRVCEEGPYSHSYTHKYS